MADLLEDEPEPARARRARRGGARILSRTPHARQVGGSCLQRALPRQQAVPA